MTADHDPAPARPSPGPGRVHPGGRQASNERSTSEMRSTWILPEPEDGHRSVAAPPGNRHPPVVATFTVAIAEAPAASSSPSAPFPGFLLDRGRYIPFEASDPSVQTWPDRHQQSRRDRGRGGSSTTARMAASLWADFVQRGCQLSPVISGMISSVSTRSNRSGSARNAARALEPSAASISSPRGAGGHHFRARQIHLEDTAHTRPARHVDRTAVVGHDAVHGRQAGTRSQRGGFDCEDRAVARVLGESPQLVFGRPIGEVLRPSRQGTGVLGRAAGLGERVDRALVLFPRLEDTWNFPAMAVAPCIDGMSTRYASLPCRSRRSDGFSNSVDSSIG